MKRGVRAWHARSCAPMCSRVKIAYRIAWIHEPPISDHNKGLKDHTYGYDCAGGHGSFDVRRLGLIVGARGKGVPKRRPCVKTVLI